MYQVTLIDSFELDKLVKDTYGKPYCFQQQDDCKPRGTYEFSLPIEYPEDYCRDEVNLAKDEMGVSFSSWLATPPESFREIEWERNFYPDAEILLQDMHLKGVLPEGDYLIRIDW